ncbi:MAG: 4Fe-4S dicluster domain-containing protein [Desulfobacteraceae bacterium]|nr:MAG: 4Fe-4S dicluster domain-containing protein [Desulfobacteraceae bacterium]
MPIEISKKTVKSDFIDKVNELSGQNIYKCMQCGMCGGSCPMAGQLDTLPRRVMRMIQLGQKENVIDCKTFWTCASCHSCSVNCPRGVDLARVMEALRLLILRKNTDHIEPSKLTAETVEELPQIAMVSGFRKLTG